MDYSRRRKINLNNLYEFATFQLTNSKNIELIKFCLSVLTLMNIETDKDTIEKVKTLALSDEFTLYCLDILVYCLDILVQLEDSNDEIFEIAKKLKDGEEYILLNIYKQLIMK